MKKAKTFLKLKATFLHFCLPEVSPVIGNHFSFSTSVHSNGTVSFYSLPNEKLCGSQHGWMMKSNWHLSFFFFFWRRLPKWQLWLSSTFKESYKRCSLSNQGRLCLCLARSFFFSSFVCFYKYKLAVNKLPYWSGDLKCFFFCQGVLCCKAETIYHNKHLITKERRVGVL